MASCVCQIENLMFILFAGAYSGMLIVDHSTFRAFGGMAPCHPHSGSVYVVRHTLSSIVKSHSSTIRALQMRQMQLALETFPSVAYFTIKHCRAWDSNSPSSDVWKTWGQISAYSSRTVGWAWHFDSKNQKKNVQAFHLPTFRTAAQRRTLRKSASKSSNLTRDPMV